MADLYPTYGRQYSRQDMASYPQYQLAPSSSSSGTMQPPSLITSQPTIIDDDPSPTQHDTGSQSPSSPHGNSPKQESSPGSQPPNTQQPPAKPQATFLTKLYALLERPENHHMIRWDPAGEHIIVERPEQLALHVLPSVYRQSRFASFSRQLNIYGFMRKVNLRNVDPAIDDPDASTWSHPTLNRHSPADVVANFKRRVPPRVPKSKKPRDIDMPTMAPRTAVGVPQNMPFGSSSPPRPRGLSAPGSFTPLTQSSAPGWGHAGYPQQGRTALPPLTVPPEPHTSSLGHNGFAQLSYASNGATSTVRDSSMLQSSGSGFPPSSSGYGYTDQNGWPPYPTSASTQHSTGSLSSLLNPSATGGTGSYMSRPTPPAITTYQSYPSLSSMSTRPHTAGGVSPDSRPATGYSVSSAVSAMSTPYDEGHFDYSRPSSSHRPITPSSSRPTSKAGYGTAATLSIRRDRRHSHAVSPYPSPYDAHPPPSGGSDRPSTSPHPHASDDYPNVSGLPRVRSMVGFGMGNETYNYNPAHGDFAYGAGDDHTTTTTHYSDYPEQPGTAYSDHPQTSHSSYSLPMSSHGYAGRNVRPSTSASSLSSNSAANTPGGEGFHGGVDQATINRFSPDFGFVPINEELTRFNKAGEL